MELSFFGILLLVVFCNMALKLCTLLYAKVTEYYLKKREEEAILKKQEYIRLANQLLNCFYPLLLNYIGYNHPNVADTLNQLREQLLHLLNDYQHNDTNNEQLTRIMYDLAHKFTTL